MSPRLHIHTLGKVTIELEGNVVKLPARSAEALFIYLLAHKNPLPREHLIELFYPNREPKQGKANVRAALSRLNRQLGDFLISDKTRIGFNHKARYWWDTAVFEKQIAPFLQSASQAPLTASQLQQLKNALDLYQGDFLSDVSLRDVPDFESWILARQERYRQWAIIGRRRLTEHFFEHGEPSQGLQQAELLLTHDSLDETTHRLLMRLYCRNRQRNKALAQFEKCRHLLDKELGVLPTNETTQLYEQIRAAHPNRNNLPPDATPLVGRRADVAKVAQHLASSQNRLLTLLGPGGIGKSRLALTVGDALLGSYLHGLFFVPLTAVKPIPNQTDADLLALAIADALELSLDGDTSSAASVTNFLANREMLLILDNFETMLDLAGKQGELFQFLTDLLQQAPGIRLLVTSRERLLLRSERVMPINGLPYPSNSLKREEILGYTAVQLLLECAARIGGEFKPKESQLRALAQITQLTQGTPLALELAGSQLPFVDATQLAADIQASLDNLQPRYRDMPTRHRSLRAVFDSSWIRLTAAEQQTMAILSIFHGSFNIKAALAVAADDSSTDNAISLKGLADKSFIRRLMPSGNVEQRYEIHAVLREFAAEKLAKKQGEWEKVRGRYGRYYTQMLHDLQHKWQNSHHATSTQMITTELANIRAAWDWILATQDLIALDQAISSFYLFLWATGRHIEGDSRFKQAAEVVAESGQHSLLLARLQCRQAEFAYLMGQTEKAETLFHTILPVLRQSNEWGELAEALGGMARLNYATADYKQALAYAEECLALYRWEEDEVGVALGLNMAATILCDTAADYEQAIPLYKESLAICREIGNQNGIARALVNLGSIAHAKNNREEAQRFYTASLPIYRQMGYAHGTGTALSMLGALARVQNNFTVAIQYLEESIDLARDTNDHFKLAVGLRELGETYRQMGKLELAKRPLRSALTLAQTVGAADQLIQTLLAITKLFAVTNQPDLAGTLLWYLKQQSVGSETKTRVEAVAVRYAYLEIPTVETQKRWRDFTLQKVTAEVLQTLS